MLKRSLIFLLMIYAAVNAQQSPYFPETGTKAIEEDIREIKNPSVYLVIAIAPGFEDLASITNFRIGEGAEVSVAYITNGEDIPSDLNGEMFYQLAARRKEEAYRALSYLGVQAYFLNIPVVEFSAGAHCFGPTSDISDLLDSRLDSVISQTSPDVIIIGHDAVSSSNESPRIDYLQNLVLKNIYHGIKSSSSKIDRVFIQTDSREKNADIQVEQKDPLWSKSYSQMAIDAEKFFESLKFQIHLWNRDELHNYAQIYPRQTKSYLPLDKGLPEISARLKSLLPVIRSISSVERFPGSDGRLSILHDVISEVDAFTSRYGNSLDRKDLRILITWKFTLEKLRRAILGVSIPYAVSDTIVTPVQVFFLRFGKLDSPFNAGTTQIIFPGVISKQWVVNESQDNFYQWKDSAEFRVLSPRNIQLNSTETPDGFKAMQVRTPLIFIVVHRDPNANHDFMYRAEIPLIIAPFRSCEVLTPQVAMFHDTSLCIRLKNNVRDRASGFFYLDDSLVSSPEDSVKMPGKNYVVTDTLPLIWKDTSMTMPREVEVWANGRTPIGSFVVHSLDVKSNIKKKIGLCSMIENSPILIALRRLGISPTVLDGTTAPDLSGFSTIIIDQFSAKRFVGISFQQGAIEHWIKDGGRLIVLPQYQYSQNNMPSIGSDRFTYLPAVGCNEKIEVDLNAMVFNSPNKIDERDFDGDSFALSYGAITNEGEGDSRVLIRSGSSILLLENERGKGSIFLCALNLFPKLLEINRASYCLLANLLD